MSNSSSQGTPPSIGKSPPQTNTPPSPSEDNSSNVSPSGSTPPSLSEDNSSNVSPSGSTAPSPTSNTPPPSPNSNTPPSPDSNTPPSPSSTSTPPSSSSNSTPPSPSSNSPPPSPSSNSPPPSPSSNSTPPSPSSNSTTPSPTPPSPSSNSLQPSPSSNSPPPSPSSNSSQPSPSSKSPPPSPNSNSSQPLPSSSPPTPSSNSPPPPTSSNSPQPSSPPPSSNGSSPPPAPHGNNSPPPSESNSPPIQNTTPPSPPPSITSPPSEFQPPGPPNNSSPPPSLPSPNDSSPNSKPSPTANGHQLGSPPTTPSEETHSKASTESSSSSATLNSYSHINSSVIGFSVALVVIVLVVISFVLITRKKKRLDGLDYRPPDRISVMTDGYRQANPMGASTRSNPYYDSGPQSGPLGVMDGSSRYGYPSRSQSCFTYEEMMDVTEGFSRENLIGEGGFGCVYKGCLQDGKKVAVKQLKAGSGQGEREFGAEVEIISRVHHRHLVSLVGYCIADSQRLLVYEFLPNNTLEHHLHGKGIPVMEWPKRVKIAVGSAKGLAYLHEDCHPRIIHRDIKSANILLEDSFEPQVADFGLAKLSNDTHTHVSTRVMGTFGYMAPEYASSGKLTDRSDVFSFGVVLLELITGRKPVDTTQPLGDESLVEWARPLLVHALETGNCEELVDPRLENNYKKSEMLRMIEAAAACVRHSAPKRPRMSQVLRALDFEDDMTDLTNGVRIGQSQAFNSDVQRFRRMAFGSSGNNSFDYDSGEYDRRSAASSGEFRSREQRPPGGRRPGDQSSQSSGNHESDTRSMFRSERSTGGGSSRQSGRGFN